MVYTGELHYRLQRWFRCKASELDCSFRSIGHIHVDGHLCGKTVKAKLELQPLCSQFAL